MTIIFSIATSDLIIMSADSAITLDFQDKREYIKGKKAYLVKGVGCVTTWGDRDCNIISQYLEKEFALSKHSTIVDLSRKVYEYLVNVYRPNELDLGDVGFHVGGFDNQGVPRLFHVFWGYDRPRQPNQKNREYKIYDHSPGKFPASFLYNGRNDLAQVLINTLINELNTAKDSHFSLNSHNNMVLLSDFVMRFAIEITPEVGLPFITYLFSKKNECQMIKNEKLSPIDPNYVQNALIKFNL